jgi:hypothetical protein
MPITFLKPVVFYQAKLSNIKTERKLQTKNAIELQVVNQIIEPEIK